MYRRFRDIALALSILSGLALPDSASAGPTVPHRESCDGKLTSVNPPSFTNPLGSMTGTGFGKATHMGLYTFQGNHNFTADGQILNGTYTNTAKDGSTISGTYSGTFTPIAPNVFRFDVRVYYLQGTGRLAGVTGVADVVATVNVATGVFHYETVGTWTFP
jgi:hypothetical protein